MGIELQAIRTGLDNDRVQKLIEDYRHKGFRVDDQRKSSRIIYVYEKHGSKDSVLTLGDAVYSLNSSSERAQEVEEILKEVLHLP